MLICRSDKIGEPSPVSVEGTAATSSNVSATAAAPPPSRGVSGVPSRLRPLIKPWFGPVPPRTLGDLLPRACLDDGGIPPELRGPPPSSGQPD